nr:hypothetical protein [uncultured Leptotrichia sp.]
MLIEELLTNRTPVTLFTRPRRFRKTLNMSTIILSLQILRKEIKK